MIELQPPIVEEAYQQVVSEVLGPVGQLELMGVDGLKDPTNPENDEDKSFLLAAIEQGQQRALVREEAAREVVHFVLSGLRAKTDEPRDLMDLEVSYEWVNIYEGHEPMSLKSTESVGSTVANHPRSKELGTSFAVDTALRLTRLLTPDIIGVVVADSERVKPNIITTVMRTDEGTVRTSEAVIGAEKAE